MKTFENNVDRQYLDACYSVICYGELKNNRTGVETHGLFGRQMRYGDYHIYRNHRDALNEQFLRKTHPLPKLVVTEGKNIFDYTPQDIKLENYVHSGALKAELNVG